METTNCLTLYSAGDNNPPLLRLPAEEEDRSILSRKKAASPDSSFEPRAGKRTTTTITSPSGRSVRPS